MHRPPQFRPTNSKSKEFSAVPGPTLRIASLNALWSDPWQERHLTSQPVHRCSEPTMATTQPEHRPCTECAPWRGRAPQPISKPARHPQPATIPTLRTPPVACSQPAENAAWQVKGRKSQPGPQSTCRWWESAHAPSSAHALSSAYTSHTVSEPVSRDTAHIHPACDYEGHSQLDYLLEGAL